MEDETVKVNCDVWDCVYSLWKKTNKSHCKLKYITISVRLDSGEKHGTDGACTSMKKEIRS